MYKHSEYMDKCDVSSTVQCNDSQKLKKKKKYIEVWIKISLKTTIK